MLGPGGAPGAWPAKGGFQLSDRQDPILLFYDGYERKAREGVAGQVFSQGHRLARYLYRRARRQQPRSGFYTWFLMLHRALTRAGYDVRVNDFATARRRPDLPIGVAGYPSVLDQVEGLSNPRLVGPGFSPFDTPHVFEDARNRLMLITCDWYAALLAQHQAVLRRWYGGFDLDEYPDSRGGPKSCDVLIYDKIYFDRDRCYAQTIAPFIAMLEREGLSYEVLRYGSHHHDEYMSAVRRSRSMAFFAHQETQGMAYQECLSSNVPVFAWNEGVWLDPQARMAGPGPAPCTSVPYWDDRCGVTFKAETMLDAWPGFLARLDTFQPRAFVADRLSLRGSAELYLQARGELLGG